jgi:adenosylmethionine---8-amino-7-oxononanoate aminotransferase
LAADVACRKYSFAKHTIKPLIFNMASFDPFITVLPTLAERDRACIWHPYTPMKLRPDLLGIVRAQGAYLYDEQARAYLDAVSSWWVNLHGHSHPVIAQAIAAQANVLAHCMFAGLTHEPAVRLAERLLEQVNATFSADALHMRRVFYSDNGSCATEIAIKMALQAFHNQGAPRTTIIALKDSYHGDTFGAMAASARGLFSLPFADKLFNVVFIEPPTDEYAQNSMAALNTALATGDVAALIVEPLVQGAAGMRMHSAQGLRDLGVQARCLPLSNSLYSLMCCAYPKG